MSEYGYITLVAIFTFTTALMGLYTVKAYKHEFVNQQSSKWWTVVCGVIALVSLVVIAATMLWGR